MIGLGTTPLSLNH